MSERKTVKINDNSRGKVAVSGAQKLGREVIYVDTDDDITSVIGRVKSAKSTVVAVVPPARVGALQSVVNLKLLQRAAQSSHKKLSLVTTDKALNSLAAGLKLPVAKNLTADAKIPAAIDLEGDDDDEISAKDMTVGELAALGDESESRDTPAEAAAVEAIEHADKIRPDDDENPPARPVAKPAKSAAPKNKKIPNFSAFRKKLLLIGGGAVILAAVLVWLFAFSTHGTITVLAKTSDQEISANLSLAPGGETSVNDSVVAPTIKTSRKSETVQFSATGTQMTGGAKATGTIKISVSTSDIDSSSGLNIPAGATITDPSSGLTYVTNDAVSFPAGLGDGSSASISKIDIKKYCGSLDSSTCYYSVNITATDFGAKYNGLASGSTVRVDGGHSAQVTSATAHGADQTQQQVVQQSDLDAAIARIQAQDNQSAIKSQLEHDLGPSVVPIDASFGVSYGRASSSPAVGATSSDKATATLAVTYTMLGVAKSDLHAFLERQALANVQNPDSQKVYNDGISSAKFANFSPAGRGNYSVTVQATAKVGPAIDAATVKKQALGKKSGEIQSALGSINGVDSVKVDFSPFWVSSISDPGRLDVKFTVDK